MTNPNLNALQVMGVKKNPDVSLQGVKPKYLQGATYHADSRKGGASRKQFKTKVFGGMK